VPGVTEPPDKLLDLIYDAATEQELWTSALIQIADMTGSLGGFVVGVENKDRLVPFLFNGRMSEESHRTYAERHIDNPWSAVMNHVPGGKLVQSAEIISLPDLKRTAFFDEVLQTGDVLFVPAGNWHHCEAGPGRSVHFSVFFLPPAGWHGVKRLVFPLIEEEMFRTPLTRLGRASELTALETEIKRRLIEKIGQLNLEELIANWGGKG